MKCKCNGCDERHIGCHSDCEAYKEFSDWRKKIRDEKIKEGDLIAYSCDTSIRIKESIRKRGYRVW